MDEKVGVEIITQGKSGIVAFQTASICDVDGIAAITEQIKEFVDKNKPNFKLGKISVSSFMTSEYESFRAILQVLATKNKANLASLSATPGQVLGRLQTQG